MSADAVAAARRRLWRRLLVLYACGIGVGVGLGVAVGEFLVPIAITAGVVPLAAGTYFTLMKTQPAAQEHEPGG